MLPAGRRLGMESASDRGQVTQVRAAAFVCAAELGISVGVIMGLSW